MCSNQIAVFCHVTSLNGLMPDLPPRSSRFLHVMSLSTLPTPFPPSSLRGKTELDKIMMRLSQGVYFISTDKHSINGSSIILMADPQSC